MFFTIFTKLSVPICGLAVYNISSGAPNLTNSSNTFLEYILELPVFNFPSENVPAPPSPNCIFEFGLNFLFLVNSSTSFILSSTHFPLSNIIGFIPFSINISPANNPAGPAPTITGFILFALLTCISGNLYFSTFSNLFSFLLSFNSISIA